MMKYSAAAVIARGAVTACSSEGTSIVTGKIVLTDERVTDGATLAVQLVDINVADAPAAVIDRQEFAADGDEFPITCELEYDPDDLVDTCRYVVEARVDLGGDLLVINDTVFPAITIGAGTDVDVPLIVVES